MRHTGPTRGPRIVQPGRRWGARGTTLAEMMVYMFLFALVLTGIVAAFTAGNRWYNTARAAIEAQQGAQDVPYRLGQELMESDLSGISFYPNSSDTSAARGVVFISPRNPSLNDAFGINPTTGRTRWYKYVCYYVASDTSSIDTRAVYRKEWVPGGLNPDAKPVQCSYDTSYFMNNQQLNAISVAHNIAPATTTVSHGGFDIFSGDPATSTPNYDTAANPICISVDTGTGENGQVNNVKTTVLVSVRN